MKTIKGQICFNISEIEVLNLARGVSKIKSIQARHFKAIETLTNEGIIFKDKNLLKISPGKLLIVDEALKGTCVRSC